MRSRVAVHHGAVGKGRVIGRCLIPLVTLWPLMSGCAIQPNPLNRWQLDQKVAQDLDAMFAGMVSPTDPIGLEQAVARAVHDNLQHRVVALEGALALGLNDLAAYSLLPQIQASQNHTQRDRTTYLTQDRFQNTSSLEAAWSVLDFGVSYISARQKSDAVLIAWEQRQKAAMDLFFEVESAFGQALVAQKLDLSLHPLVVRLEKALDNAREVERQGIRPAQESLDFQKRLLKILDQLQRLQRQISASRPRLAELINLQSGRIPPLVDPGFILPMDIGALPSMGELEEFALKNRPELLERHYQGRVQADESRKALLRLLPGLELTSKRRYDSSGNYDNHHWTENGVSLAWNLIKVVTGPEILAQAQLEEAMEGRKRLALSMTIITQVRVAHLGLMESMASFETANELSKVDRRLFEHVQAGRDVATMSEAQLIEAEADLLLQDAKRDLAWSELSAAAGRLLVSLGLNRFPHGFDTMETQELTQALEEIARRPAWASHAMLIPQKQHSTQDSPTESSPQGEKSGKSPEPGQQDPPDEPVWIIESSRVAEPPRQPTTTPDPQPEVNPKSNPGPLRLDTEKEGESGMVLRVGAFVSQDHAKRLYSWLAEKKYPVIMKTLTDEEGRTLYQVCVGPVQGMEQSRVLLDALNAQEGLEDFLKPLPPSETVQKNETAASPDAVQNLNTTIPKP